MHNTESTLIFKATQEYPTWVYDMCSIRNVQCSVSEFRNYSSAGLAENKHTSNRLVPIVTNGYMQSVELVHHNYIVMYSSQNDVTADKEHIAPIATSYYNGHTGMSCWLVCLPQQFIAF